MNQDDIIKMAQEAGLVLRGEPMLGVERFAALIAAAAIPEGWKLVPIQPTEAMLDTVRQKPHPTRPDGWDDRHTAIYQKMVLAAHPYGELK